MTDSRLMWLPEFSCLIVSEKLDEFWLMKCYFDGECVYWYGVQCAVCTVRWCFASLFCGMLSNILTDVENGVWRCTSCAIFEILLSCVWTKWKLRNQINLSEMKPVWKNGIRSSIIDGTFSWVFLSISMAFLSKILKKDPIFFFDVLMLKFQKPFSHSKQRILLAKYYI